MTARRSHSGHWSFIVHFPEQCGEMVISSDYNQNFNHFLMADHRVNYSPSWNGSVVKQNCGHLLAAQLRIDEFSAVHGDNGRVAEVSDACVVDKRPIDIN